MSIFTCTNGVAQCVADTSRWLQPQHLLEYYSIEVAYSVLM